MISFLMRRCCASDLRNLLDALRTSFNHMVVLGHVSEFLEWRKLQEAPGINKVLNGGTKPAVKGRIVLQSGTQTAVCQYPMQGSYNAR